MTTPVPAPAPMPDGKTLGIVGLVLAFVFSIAGLIVSIIARGQSKRAGVPNTPATVGIVISIIALIFWTIGLVITIGGAVALLGTCGDLGPGVHQLDGVTITCG